MSGAGGACLLACVLIGCSGLGTHADIETKARLTLCAGAEVFDTPVENAVAIWNQRLTTAWGPRVAIPRHMYSLETAILHEVGHVALRAKDELAEHTAIPGSVMWRYVRRGERLAWLHAEDLAKIEAYGARALVYQGVGHGDPCDITFVFGNPGTIAGTTLRHLAVVKKRQGLVILDDTAPWFLPTSSLFDQQQ